MPRRDFLRLGAAAFALGLVPFESGCLPTGETGGIEPAGPPKTPPDNWLRDARTAGMEVMVDATPHELGMQLDALAAAGVNVVEADCDLSSYLTEDDFQPQLEVLDLVAYGAHLRGMRCVAYYPTFEVLTADADTAEHVMSKEHPDWVQTNIDGTPNKFVGGGGLVFWVDPGVESCWMCPLTGYRQYFLDRVRRLAQTRLDGLWGDVPLLSDIAGDWPCVNAACREQFKRDTGLDIPSKVPGDFSQDPVFRRWVVWRHQIIWDFEQDVLKTIKAVRSTSELIIETVTMDYSGGTIQGLDGAFAAPGELVRVWEVDVVSDATAMRGAAAIDWACLAVMMRHATGGSYGRPSWIFTYGDDEDDAERVMALAIATRNNPYETKSPLMCTTVGDPYRQRMYDWMARQTDLYTLPGANRAAVLHSTTSRDFLDQSTGVGLYESLNAGDPLWWSSEDPDPTHKMPYLADYRGTCIALMHAHVPFDVVPVASVSGQSLAAYKLLVVPSVVSLSNAVIAALGDFVSGGGTVLVTGSDGGTYDEIGTARPAPGLLPALGIVAGTADWAAQTKGSGIVVHVSTRAGHDYFQSGDAALLARIAGVAAQAGVQLTTTAPQAVLFDLRRDTNGPVLVCANMMGLGDKGMLSTQQDAESKYTQQDASFRMSLPDEGKQPLKVLVSEPTAGATDHEVPFTHENGLISFDMTVHALSMVRLTLG